jgi:acetate kinase
MNVLAFNPGSNSLKFQVIRQPPKAWGRKLITGTIEPIGPEAKFKAATDEQGTVLDEKLPVKDQGAAASAVLRKINDGVFAGSGIDRLSKVDLIACRVVHGASRFHEPTHVNAEVLRGIEELDDLAPLHNAQAVAIIRACLNADHAIPIVAVFDSAFHSTLPEVAYRYAIEYELANRRGIRRYGFHGISHRYLMLRFAELQGISPEESTIITLHLEGGSSATAIRNGKSVDTSMGFTPLEGLMMATRCGDLDPAIIPFLVRSEKAELATVEEWLNKKSGLLGVSGSSPDTRILVKRTDERSRLAIEMFAYRVRKYIGSYLAVLNGASAVVFGGGISENTPEIRELICSSLEYVGLDLDTVLNKETVDREGRITRPSSRLHAWVIPTEEGLMLARQAADANL